MNFANSLPSQREMGAGYRLLLLFVASLLAGSPKGVAAPTFAVNVLDTESNPFVSIYDSAGGLTFQGTVSLSGPPMGIHDLAFGSSGQLYLLAGNNAATTGGIYSFDPLTNTTSLIVSRPVLESGNLAIAPDGRFAVNVLDTESNPFVSIYDSAGGLTFQGTVSLSGPPMGIHDLAFGSSGQLYLLAGNNAATSGGIYSFDPLTNTTSLIVSRPVLESGNLAVLVTAIPEVGGFFSLGVVALLLGGAMGLNSGRQALARRHGRRFLVESTECK